MKSGKDILVPDKINFNEFEEPLTFNLVPATRQTLYSFSYLVGDHILAKLFPTVVSCTSSFAA